MKKCVSVILLLVICLSCAACDAYGLMPHEREAVNTVLDNSDDIMRVDLDSCSLLRDNSGYFLGCNCGKTEKNGYTYYESSYYYRIKDGELTFVEEGVGFFDNHEQCRSSDSFGFSIYMTRNKMQEALVNAIKQLR